MKILERCRVIHGRFYERKIEKIENSRPENCDKKSVPAGYFYASYFTKKMVRYCKNPIFIMIQSILGNYVQITFEG